MRERDRGKKLKTAYEKERVSETINKKEKEGKKERKRMKGERVVGNPLRCSLLQTMGH